MIPKPGDHAPRQFSYAPRWATLFLSPDFTLFRAFGSGVAGPSVITLKSGVASPTRNLMSRPSGAAKVDSGTGCWFRWGLNATAGSFW